MANRNPSPKTRFQRGQVNNPEGARTHNPVIKALRNLTINAYREAIELALTGGVSELEQLAADPNANVVQVGVAKSLLKALEKGDWFVIDKIAERLIGKTPDYILTQQVPRPIVPIDMKRLKEAIKKIEAEV